MMSTNQESKGGGSDIFALLVCHHLVTGAPVSLRIASGGKCQVEGNESQLEMHNNIHASDAFRRS